MKSFTKRSVIVLIVAALAAWTTVSYAVVIETVPVGDLGNTADTAGEPSPAGAVDYAYNIGKYTVTNTEYAEFLNAVDSDGFNNYGLHYASMEIAYSVSWSANTGMEQRPLQYIDWGSAFRFANWLHNGQPTAQLSGDPSTDAGSTEDGAYFLDGATAHADLYVITREFDWQWAIPSEDEWYKAAFYKGGGPDRGYWTYPTQSDTAPTAATPGADPNTANLDNAVGGPVDVGSYTGSPGPYGTYDQAGNVFEAVETPLPDPRYIIMRDVSWDYHPRQTSSSRRDGDPGDGHFNKRGFRVVQIPEPGSITLLVMGLLGLAFVARRKRK